MKPKARFMQAAIDDVVAHFPQEPGGPFGACVVRGDEIIAVSHNTVLEHKDPTCHAEINAIRAASKHLDRFDLSDCVIYSTTEPCPMCFSAIHWARLDTIVFGTRIADVQALGFNELDISNEDMKKIGKSSITVVSDFMRDECAKMLSDWNKKTGGKTY